MISKLGPLRKLPVKNVYHLNTSSIKSGLEEQQYKQSQKVFMEEVLESGSAHSIRHIEPPIAGLSVKESRNKLNTHSHTLNIVEDEQQAPITNRTQYN